MLLASCAPAPSKARAEPPPEVTLEQVTLHVFRGSSMVARGTASQLTFRQVGSQVTARDARWVVPERQLAVAAPRARGNAQARTLEGEGGVTVRSEQGLSGQTARAYLNGPARKVSGQDPVTLEGPAYRLEANAFVVDLTDEHFTFESGVSSTWTPGAARP